MTLQNSELTLDGIIIPRGSAINFSYTGATSNRFRDYSHIPMQPQTEAAALPQWERNVIVSRLRHLVKNDAYVASLVGAFGAQIGNSTLRVTSKDKRYNTAKENYWLNWQENCEVTGLSLSEVEEVIFTELLCAGEVFFLKLATGKIQMVPSEYIFSPSDVPDGEVQGISYDATGNALAYRIGYRNEQGRLTVGEKLTPASQVVHLYKRTRVEELRGSPWLSSALNAIQDLQEIVDAKVISTKAQSLVAAIVTKQTLGAPSLGDGRDSNGKRTGLQTLKSGSIYYLEAGETMEAFQSSIQAADFDQFLLSRLRVIGASIGMPLELWVEGYRDSNYSSARSTNLQWARRVKGIRQLIGRKFLEPLNLWQSERARAQGVLAQTSRKNDKEVFWGFPALPSIDEGKEVEANIKKLEAGLTTYSEIYAEKNLFFEDEMRTRAHDARVILDAAKAEGIDPMFLIPALAAFLPRAAAPVAADTPPIEPPAVTPEGQTPVSAVSP